MRVVMLGKGGSGKSTLAGLLAVELTSRGERVVAIDADTVPGLAQVLGMEPSDSWDLANMAIRDNGGWRLDGTPAEIVARCSRPAPTTVPTTTAPTAGTPAGTPTAATAAPTVPTTTAPTTATPTPTGASLRFLQSGNVDANLRDIEFRREAHLANWSGTVAFNSVSRQYDDPDGWSIVDLQGGTLQVANGMAGTKGVALLIVEPFAKSTMTARRFVGMGEWPAGLRLAAVANKVASPDEAEYVESEMAALGVPLWTVVPTDAAVQRAERDGRPLVTVDPETPAKLAVARLVDRLLDARQPVPQ